MPFKIEYNSNFDHILVKKLNTFFSQFDSPTVCVEYVSTVRNGRECLTSCGVWLGFWEHGLVPSVPPSGG